MARAGGAVETEAKPLPAAKVDLGELGTAELVQALQSGDLDTQLAAVAEVLCRFRREVGAVNDDSELLACELVSCGVVPAVLRLVQPDAADACTEVALQALFELVAFDLGPVLIASGGCETCWAVVHRFSESGGNVEAADMAMSIVADLLGLSEFEERQNFAELHGEALLALLSRHASFASDFLCKLTQVFVDAFDASEIFMRLADAPSLRSLSACLLRFQAERLVDGGIDAIKTLSALFDCDAAPDYFDLRLCGVLAAVIPWMAAAYGQCFTEYDHNEATSYEVAAHRAASLVSAVYISADDDSRRRLFDMLCMQPGALAGLFYDSWSPPFDNSKLIVMSEVVRCHLRIDVCLLDSQLMMCHLASACRNGRDDDSSYFYDDLEQFVSGFDAECLAALSMPMHNQRLAAAASAGVMSCINLDARRLFASGDRIEVVLNSFIATADCAVVNGCSAVFLRTALFSALTAAVIAANLWPADDCGPGPFFRPCETHRRSDALEADTGAPPKLKRPRLSAFTLTAADVNVQRRDSTVFLVAGRAFHAVGIIMEKSSAVLADALRDAPAQASVTVAMPADVPEELHYELFSAAVEYAYTGDVTAALNRDSLFYLWCIGDYLCMDALCAWCTERFAQVFQADSDGTFELFICPIWKRAADRCAMQLCDMCATAYLRKLDWRSTGRLFPQLLAAVDADAPPGCKPSAHVARVLRDALLRTLPPADEAQ